MQVARSVGNTLAKWPIHSLTRRRGCSEEYWWARQDLNLGPTDYESAALTAELQARNFHHILH